ncbi:unnamed protein product [Caenorhabditis angaria]|uniref:Secreted protein n=1 Tax=Caenorhabditis angaria TaxID=860376 RepID=A0A9P1I6U5_9PELO|nr:unnamed protein product [Caenorhabditis angaria]
MYTFSPRFIFSLWFFVFSFHQAKSVLNGSVSWEEQRSQMQNHCEFLFGVKNLRFAGYNGFPKLTLKH